MAKTEALAEKTRQLEEVEKVKINLVIELATLRE